MITNYADPGKLMIDDVQVSTVKDEAQIKNCVYSSQAAYDVIIKLCVIRVRFSKHADQGRIIQHAVPGRSTKGELQDNTGSIQCKNYEICCPGFHDEVC